MKDILLEGLEELATGLGIYATMAVAAALVRVAFGGWKGFRHFCSLVVIGLFMSTMAGWGCQYYGLPWVATALITGGAALLSFSIMSLIHNPAIHAAIVERIANEIRTRGRGKGAGRDAEGPHE